MVALYERYEGRFNSAVMFAGFVTDWILFRRIDHFFENVVLLAYLGIAAFGITVVNLVEGGKLKWKFFGRLRLWLPLMIQYAFGGLFSAFVIFYVKSASLATSWPFLLVLIAILIGNEFSRKRYVQLTLHMSIFYIAVTSFLIFYMPIIIHRINVWVFLLSGVLGLILIALFIKGLRGLIPKRIDEALPSLIASIGTIFVIINIFYFVNVIPPIPLALKEVDVYHHVNKIGREYHVRGEEKKWYEQFRIYDRIHITDGSPVYVFTSVFAPTELRTGIHHHWMYEDERGRWVTASKIPYPIVGGRDEGYRGHTVKRAVFPGKWRVDIETERGQDIGRIKFRIINVPEAPELISDVR